MNSDQSRTVILHDGRNFDAWDAWIRAELLTKGCWDIIKGTKPRPKQHPSSQVDAKGQKSPKGEIDTDFEFNDLLIDEEELRKAAEGVDHGATTTPSGVIIPGRADGTLLPPVPAAGSSSGIGLNDLLLNETAVYPAHKLDATADEKMRKKRKKKIKEWDKLARKALGIILKSLHPSILPLVGAEENPRKVYLTIYH
jgi:hypothetical protein